MAWRKRILTSIIIGDFRLHFRSKFLIGADNLCIERFELVESSSTLWPNGKTFNLLREHEHEASTHRGEPSSAGPDGEPKIMIWFHNPCLPEQRLETFQSGNGYARSGIPKYQAELWSILKIFPLMKLSKKSIKTWSIESLEKIMSNFWSMVFRTEIISLVRLVRM